MFHHLSVLSSSDSQRGQFQPSGDIWPCLETFLLITAGDGVGKGYGIQWVEAGAAVKPLACTRQSLTTKDYLASKVNSAEGGKPCFNSPSPNVNSWLRSNQGKLSSIDLRVSYFPGIAVLKVWSGELLGDTANYSFL